MDGGDILINLSERRDDRMTGKKKLSEAAEIPGETEHMFSKEQLIASDRFRNRRDLVKALLDTGELYTVKAAEEKIQNYMKGKVK
jgi:hypothetical protein